MVPFSGLRLPVLRNMITSITMVRPVASKTCTVTFWSHEILKEKRVKEKKKGKRKGRKGEREEGERKEGKNSFDLGPNPLRNPVHDSTLWENYNAHYNKVPFK